MSFSEKYCRTTAQGRRFWEAVEALIYALVQIVESNWVFRMEERRWVEEGGRGWPDLTPALEKARQLGDQLDGGYASLCIPRMDWSHATLEFLKLVTGVLLRALRSIRGRELDCMSVRAMNIAWSPHHNMLNDNIVKIGGHLKIFVTLASAFN